MARIVWALLCVLAASSALFTTPTSAAEPKPSPPKGSAVDCSTVIYDMMDCLGYVSAGSNTSKPDESCCEGIKSVVQLSPSCLCEALQEAASMKIDLNMTRAEALPVICKISVPSVDTCNIAGSPGPAPAASAPSKPKSPPPSHPPALPLPAPSTSPVVPSSPAESPTKTTHNASAPAPLPSGAPTLPFNVVVLAVCQLVAASFLHV